MKIDTRNKGLDGLYAKILSGTEPESILVYTVKQKGESRFGFKRKRQ